MNENSWAGTYATKINGLYLDAVQEVLVFGSLPSTGKHRQHLFQCARHPFLTKDESFQS